VSNASPGVMGNTSGKRKQLRKRPNALSGKKLTPIEHAKAQFELSNPGSTNKSKRIFQKKDLVDAVRKVQTVRCNTSPQTTDLISRDPSKSSILAEPEVRNPASREVEFLEEGVNHNARKFNDMKMMADKKQQELDKLIDIHKELKMENHALSKIKNKQTTDATKIGQLTKEIEKVPLLSTTSSCCSTTNSVRIFEINELWRIYRLLVPESPSLLYIPRYPLTASYYNC